METTQKKISILESEIEKVESKPTSVSFFNSLVFHQSIAAILTVAGIVVGIWGLMNQFNTCGQIKLNELGDFIGGAVGSLWSLAGIVLIYIAFLGQKQQIKLQQMELKHSRLEILYSRLEQENQRIELQQ